MVMAIFHESDSGAYGFSIPAPTENSSAAAPAASPAVVPLVRSKLETPNVREHFEREWLLGLLERCTKKGAATILIGRAGSGKTALVTDHVRRVANHSWYSIDPSDADWHTFQRYFRAAVIRTHEQNGRRKTRSCEVTFSPTPTELFADITAALELRELSWPELVVLDGLHHLYDCDWFEEFFHFLVMSVPYSSHIVLTARSRPSAPIWRMRSKQVLNVIDEKLLAFSLADTVRLFAGRGLEQEVAKSVHSRTFGRPGEIMSFIESTGAHFAAC